MVNIDMKIYMYTYDVNIVRKQHEHKKYIVKA